MTTVPQRSPQPWYREPWPWLLMAGPAIVIVAGIFTAWLAVRSSDGLVAEDYYKLGLAAGQTVARSRRAEELGIVAALRLSSESMQVRLQAGPMEPPPALLVTLSHPTRAGLDQQLRLARSGDGYAAAMHLPASGHWLVLIEDEGKTWRLMGSVLLPAAKETLIGGTAADRPQS